MKKLKEIIDKIMKTGEKENTETQEDSEIAEDQKHLSDHKTKYHNNPVIIAVWGHGQCGKTSTAINLSVALSKEQGRAVCLVSAETYGELGLLFGKRITQERSITEIVKWEKNMRDTLTEDETGVHLLSPSTESDVFEYTLSDVQCKQLLELAKTMYDYVIVDCTSELSNSMTGTALSIADMVIVPVGGTVTEYAWLKANAKILEDEHYLANNTLYVRNDTTKNFDFATLSDKLNNIEFACTLPYLPEMVSCHNDGRPAYQQTFGRRILAYKNGIDELVKVVMDNAV